MKSVITPLTVAAVLILALILPIPDWALTVILFPASIVLIWWGFIQWQKLKTEEAKLNQQLEASSARLMSEQDQAERLEGKSKSV